MSKEAKYLLLLVVLDYVTVLSLFLLGKMAGIVNASVLDLVVTSLVICSGVVTVTFSVLRFWINREDVYFLTKDTVITKERD